MSLRHWSRAEPGKGSSKGYTFPPGGSLEDTELPKLVMYQNLTTLQDGMGIPRDEGLSNKWQRCKMHSGTGSSSMGMEMVRGRNLRAWWEGKPCPQKRDQDHDSGRDALFPHSRENQATATTGNDGILASHSTFYQRISHQVPVPCGWSSFLCLNVWTRLSAKGWRGAS